MRVNQKKFKKLAVIRAGDKLILKILSEKLLIVFHLKKNRKKPDFIKCLLKVFISATIVRGKFLLFINFYCTKNEVFH